MEIVFHGSDVKRFALCQTQHGKESSLTCFLQNFKGRFLDDKFRLRIEFQKACKAYVRNGSGVRLLDSNTFPINCNPLLEAGSNAFRWLRNLQDVSSGLSRPLRLPQTLSLFFRHTIQRGSSNPSNLHSECKFLEIISVSTPQAFVPLRFLYRYAKSSMTVCSQSRRFFVVHKLNKKLLNQSPNQYKNGPILLSVRLMMLAYIKNINLLLIL